MQFWRSVQLVPYKAQISLNNIIQSHYYYMILATASIFPLWFNSELRFQEWRNVPHAYACVSQTTRSYDHAYRIHCVVRVWIIIVLYSAKPQSCMQLPSMVPNSICTSLPIIIMILGGPQRKFVIILQWYTPHLSNNNNYYICGSQ